MVNSQTAIKQLNALKKRGSDMRLAAEQWKNNFQTLIAIILSARTRDETTIKICKELFAKFPYAKDLSKARLSQIEKIIKPVNFYKNKSKNISKCSKVLVKNYNSKVPEDIGELIKLPGVGRKTANVFLTEIGDYGLGVDTHVNYCSRKLGWTRQTENKPDKIEKDLKKLFPKIYWNKVNSILVRFGKTHLSRKKKDEILGEIKKIK
jgi:endonuclease-3